MFKITPRFAQNNYLICTGEYQAFEGLGSVASNMIGFGSFSDGGVGALRIVQICPAILGVKTSC